MVEGVDYSGARPSPLCLYGKGKRFVGRYFGPGGSWKHASRAEVAAHVAVGLSVVVLAEGDKYDPLDGRPAGRAHALSANAAMLVTRVPTSRPIYFAVDFDMTTRQAGAVANYLRGCADVVGLHRVGVYGGYDVVEWAHAQGLATWFMQTYAWSNGRWSSHAHIQQYRNGVTVCGGDTDLCRASRLDYGQWPAPVQAIGSAPAPPAESTVDSGWDFTTHVDALADTMTSLGSAVGNCARAIDALGT